MVDYCYIEFSPELFFKSQISLLGEMVQEKEIFSKFSAV